MLDFKQSVRARLGLGFVLIVVLMIALSGLAMRSIQQARDDTTRMYETYLIGVATLAQIRGMLVDLNSDIRIALNSSGPADNVRNLSDRIQNTRAKLKADWRRYYPHRGASSEQRKIAGRADASLKRIDQALGRFAEQMADDSKLGAAGFYRTSLHKPLEQFSGQLTRLLARQNKAAALAHARSARSARNGQTIIVTATTIVIALGLLIMFYATRMVVRPLQETRGFVQRLANGNLERRQMTAYRDEFGVVLQAVESMRERLSGVVFDVRERSDSVSVGATEIASGNEELSHRTQAQAASLEQTAASMEQMTATVKQNADNAAQADELARDVRSQARKSSEVVGCAVRSMAAIDESSRKITDIIGLIDDIAFQTNLLALNASVEAARAGEQGRGFAVVAHEVRNLASRSAAAAKDIKTLVADSAAKVAEGSDNVASSGRALDEIEAAVAKVSDIVAEIAAASREQSAGIDQVNQAVSEMDSVTQQNASLVQESAAAGHALEEQARELRTRVDFFQLPGDENLALKIVEAKTSATAKATREHAPASRHTKVVTSTEAADQEHAWARF